MGRELDPSFKVVEHAHPVVMQLLRRKHSPRTLARRTAAAGREAMNALRVLPKGLAELTQTARTESLQIQFVHRNLDVFMRERDRSSNRLSFAIVIGATVVGSSIVIRAGVGPNAFGYSLLGVAGFVVAGILGAGLAVGVLRSGRL